MPTTTDPKKQIENMLRKVSDSSQYVAKTPFGSIWDLKRLTELDGLYRKLNIR
jgi:hypothetical protein